ncbi:hypothetical protein T8K17_21880 [Thalassobaculum sp. OXR-137]|uniref:hypothetical protein n=1 Tax=Thalassobaculum sp. OXR-137 TaxID=3100173 RepID=UPI002AC8F173|nr:hypothetical protein [Thalassobaculum sp. OXR-137]WPZ33875.1 hypothetical protein T8K17_21880 [Thalassobaculum sp. OXR-137]
MSSDDRTASMRQAFEAMTALNGLTLPSERVETIYEGFVGLQAMVADLRRPRTAAAEPAGIFVPTTITRSAAP